MTTFNDVLDALRMQARNTREQGTLFEDLMETILPQLPDMGFEQVWSWKDWPARHAQTGMNAQDVGIDLVGKRTDEDGFCAIQCKFYDPATSITESDLGTFFTQSGKDAFSSRLIITTTDKWTKHAATAIRHQDKSTNRMRLADLAEYAIDWDIHKPKKTKLDITKYTLKDRQKQARDAVINGLKTADRGKLIMACGTGKTLTSLHIAEMMIEGTGHVLFMVPSISLLAQSLHEWSFQRRKDHRYIAVCSDTKVDKTSEDTAVEDLAIPASTNAHKVANILRQNANRLTVVFCTYQSIDIIHKAQQMGAPSFDLVICDEAHRTTGIDRANLPDGKTSPFVRVHDDAYLKAAKRLYMTATPRIYTEGVKEKAATHDVGIYSMDDEAEYGAVLYRLSFSDAINEDLLSDYRVVVLNMSESDVSRDMQSALSSDEELNVSDVAKIIGCYNALRNRPEERDSKKLKRVVSFSNTIKNSKRIRDHFQAVVNKFDEREHDDFTCETDHVDGTNTALERKNKLDWLREPAGANEHGEICRILSNARCLTEGVDVPSLDAAIFMNPRKSQVDVVQAVGRVMRKAEGKQYGYVILPIVIPAGKTPEEALDDNETYAVVWEILRALRSHDDRLTNMINKLDLNVGKSDFLQIIGGDAWGDKDKDSDGEKIKDEARIQLDLHFDEELRNAIYAKLVEKVGDRQYWETWARDVAHIHELLITRITDLYAKTPDLKTHMDEFVASLRLDINDAVQFADAISILAQQLITEPIFSALFDQYDFAGQNAVSKALNHMLEYIRPYGLEHELRDMERFYDSVRQRVSGIDNAAGRQKVVIELYEKFFKTAFPKTAESLGIAYTPIEIVDFILHSADHVLRSEFGRGIGDEDVHVIDPFTGTGTFINRLITNPALIPDDKLPHKYAHEIHANEMLLMAYYIASVNIEEAYHARMSMAGGGAKTGDNYMPFPGIVLTDTFQLYERAASRQGDMDSHYMPDNNERRNRQIKAPIRVIVGNPPYSAGQKSANDDNKNLAYPNLDESIRSTYAAQSTATNKNALYDSYIRAFKWASDRIGDEGVIAYVSNAGWLDSSSADGMRKCLADEFDAIYIFNLKGDARLSGEAWRKQGDKIFGQASRVPVAIILLVKNTSKPFSQAVIHYHDIGDYLRRDEKLAKIANAASIAGLDWQTIIPNPEGDWLNQRDPAFQNFMQLGRDEVKRGKVVEPDTVFRLYGNGVKTNRDAWAYNFAKSRVSDNMQAMIDFCNKQRVDFQVAKQKHPHLKIDDFKSNDPTKISWGGLADDIEKSKPLTFDRSKIVLSQYRPFARQHLYFGRRLNERVYQMPSIFPSTEIENRVIATTGISSSSFSTLLTEQIPDVQFGQCFPRYTYDEDGSNQQDNIPNEALQRFRVHYADDTITRDDIFDYVYGILHAPDYRTKFANDLTKELPRIPFAPGSKDIFRAFAMAGKRLADLHLNYETGDEYGLNVMVDGAVALGDILLDDGDYHVKKMSWASRTDKTAIRYNNRITLTGIPADALRYVVSGKPALDWVIDRYCIKTDKASGITNDANDWIAEQTANGGKDNGRAPPRDALIRLIQRVTHLSVETMKIVDNLPPSLER